MSNKKLTLVRILRQAQDERKKLSMARDRTYFRVVKIILNSNLFTKLIYIIPFVLSLSKDTNSSYWTMSW